MAYDIVIILFEQLKIVWFMFLDSIHQKAITP